MSDEQTEMLKKLLSKVENLEKKLEERDAVIAQLRKEGVPKPDNRPLPPESDRLARLAVKLARDKADFVTAQKEEKERQQIKVEELKRDFGMAQLAQFALKNRLLKEGKESSNIESGETAKVYEKE